MKYPETLVAVILEATPGFEPGSGGFAVLWGGIKKAGISLEGA